MAVMIPICTSGDVNLVHLAKVVAGRILPWELTIFPFIITKHSRRENLRLCVYPILASTFTYSPSIPP